MSRAERLLELMQCLRRHRHPVSGSALAEELGISLRTIYRDIASLQAQGAQIEGEPGIGYVLRPGFTLPPLMFSEEEIEAISLGTQWVASRTDSSLSKAARNALAKISAVLTPELRRKLADSTLQVGPLGPCGSSLTNDVELELIRTAIRSEYKITIQYQDEKGDKSTRTIWPFVLGFFERVQVVGAWCELRQSFRHFRADRLLSVDILETSYPRRRHDLLKEWQQLQGIHKK